MSNAQLEGPRPVHRFGGPPTSLSMDYWRSSSQHQSPYHTAAPTLSQPRPSERSVSASRLPGVQALLNQPSAADPGVPGRFQWPEATAQGVKRDYSGRIVTQHPSDPYARLKLSTLGEGPASYNAPRPSNEATEFYQSSAAPYSSSARSADTASLPSAQSWPTVDSTTYTVPDEHPVGRSPPRGHSTATSRPHTPGSGRGGPTAMHPSTTTPSSSSNTKSNSTFDVPPRCLGQRYVEGEGFCWIFADGTYCRTIIDGEPVNPSWGVTKAGKARKRLAQACLTCREKKIKCEPAFPKCVQCEKSGKICKRSPKQNLIGPFADSPQEYSKSISQPPSDRGLSAERSQGPNAADPFMSNTTSKVPSVTDKDSAIATTDHPPWRTSPKTDMMSQHNSKMAGFDAVKFPRYGMAPQRYPSFPPSTTASLLDLNIDCDPFQMLPSLCEKLLDLYFDHFNATTYGVYPRQTFIRWARSKEPKTEGGRMLLYAVLSIGSLFVDDLSVGKRMFEIAAQAVFSRHGIFTLSLVQTRLLLALYCFGRGKPGAAWDFSGSAFRALTGLKLNRESDVDEYSDDIGLRSVFTDEQWQECRRRTFWCAFLMDRYSGICGGTVCILQKEDAFARLPCAERAYDESNIPVMPYIDDGQIDAALAATASFVDLGSMAHLIRLAAIWTDVIAGIGRATLQSNSTYLRKFAVQYQSLHTGLDNWEASLPPQFRYSVENLHAAARSKRLGAFVSVHALYHTTTMKLNRHARTTVLAPETIVHNLREARRHAQFLVQMMIEVGRYCRTVEAETEAHPRDERDLPFSAPFPGYALLSATDILTAGGKRSEIPALVTSLLTASQVLDRMAIVWASAKAQRRTLSKRIEELAQVGLTGPTAASSLGFPPRPTTSSTTATSSPSPTSATSPGHGAPTATGSVVLPSIASATNEGQGPSPTDESSSTPDEFFRLERPLDSVAGCECDVVYEASREAYTEALRDS